MTKPTYSYLIRIRMGNEMRFILHSAYNKKVINMETTTNDLIKARKEGLMTEPKAKRIAHWADMKQKFYRDNFHSDIELVLAKKMKIKGS